MSLSHFVRGKLFGKPLARLLLLGAGAGALALSAFAVLPVGSDAAAQAPRLRPPAMIDAQTLSFADLVERVSPAVVSVYVQREIERPQIPSELEQFFQFRFGMPRDGGPTPFGDAQPRRVEAQGSGFFIDGQGHIVTNNHVVEGSSQIEVRLTDGSRLQARLVGADPLTDLAVLKVEASRSQPFVEFADDVNLRVGDWVIAVGNPFGLSGTVTSGIVSAIGGQDRAGAFLDFIQIDAPINRGNSGGPTFDLHGRVVGVNTAIYSTTGGAMGIGFAIPAKVAKETVAQLIATGAVTRGWLGVQIQPVTTELAAALGRAEAKGALVADVLPGTPAAQAGLRNGDLVLSVNDREIADPRDLTRFIAAIPPGERARVAVLRDGQQKVLNVTLGQRDNEQTARAQPSPGNGGDAVAGELGLRVSEITPALRQQFRLPDTASGVLVTGVQPGSPAERAGLTTGAIILELDGKGVTNAAGLRRIVEDARRANKDALLLRYQTGELKQFGALPLKRGE